MSDTVTQPYLDPGTWQLVMPFGQPVTGEEWRKIVWPPCPKCGHAIQVDRIDVTTQGEKIRVYIPGLWECPNECDPRQ